MTSLTVCNQLVLYCRPGTNIEVLLQQHGVKPDEIVGTGWPFLVKTQQTHLSYPPTATASYSNFMYPFTDKLLAGADSLANLLMDQLIISWQIKHLYVIHHLAPTVRLRIRSICRVNCVRPNVKMEYVKEQAIKCELFYNKIEPDRQSYNLTVASYDSHRDSIITNGEVILPVLQFKDYIEAKWIKSWAIYLLILIDPANKL